MRACSVNLHDTLLSRGMSVNSIQSLIASFTLFCKKLFPYVNLESLERFKDLVMKVLPVMMIYCQSSADQSISRELFVIMLHLFGPSTSFPRA